MRGQNILTKHHSPAIRPADSGTAAEYEYIPTAVGNFRNDPLFPKIERVVNQLLTKGKVVAPIDVLIGMDILDKRDVEKWRLGQVPYLERVIRSNLTRLGRLLRILRFHVHDLNLKPSMTVYMRYGKGRRSKLRFSKTGNPGIEAAYSCHFIWPGKGPFHPPTSTN